MRNCRCCRAGSLFRNHSGFLKRLEYRGYDSSGIVTQSGGAFQMNRAVGKLRNLSEVMREAPLDGQSGLGHTRWATHGGVSERNAHPHMAGDKVVIVHNGIIENHVALRAELEAKGHSFSSETDSEVLAHLFLEAFNNGLSPQQAGKQSWQGSREPSRLPPCMPTIRT